MNQLYVFLKRLGTSVAALFASLFALQATGHEISEPVLVWDYHTFAPFHLEEEPRGLSHDLIRMLKKHGEDYDYQLMPTSRARVNKHVELLDRGLLLWANPLWFPKLANDPRYKWSIPLLEDANDLLSRQTQPFDYAGPESLFGLRLGVVQHWRISPLEASFASGKIVRTDASELRHNLSRLLSGRVDVALVPRSAAHFLIDAWQLENEVHISSSPLQTFERRILLINYQQDAVVLEEFNAAIRTMAHDPQWIKILAKYGLKPDTTANRIRP